MDMFEVSKIFHFLVENIFIFGGEQSLYILVAGGGGGKYPFHASLSRQQSQEKNAVQGFLISCTLFSSSPNVKTQCPFSFF